MSSTNRSDARDAHISDYYITPIVEINKFLIELNKIYGGKLSNGKILDPCAGGDINSPMSYPEALKYYSKNIMTIDIRQDSRAEIIGDYLKTDCKGMYDVIITNPPFAQTLEIVQKALDDVKPGGIVVMLEKLNFFGSDKRKQFWENNMPMYCFVHHKRMSFTGKGTDSIEYCHLIWEKDKNPEYTQLKII
jgi:hypothetical protein